jgi:hypothetical protein
MADPVARDSKAAAIIPLTSPYDVKVNLRTSVGITQGTGADWFGPQNPLAPIAPPEVRGRVWDYPVSFNTIVRPRAYEAVGFGELRALAQTYDLLALIIETRKDQLSRMEWNIVPKDESIVEGKTSAPAGLEKRSALITAFFNRPDRHHRWNDWLRMVLDDVLIIDAPTLFCERSRGGQLIGLRVVDGATIKRVIDDWGMTPEPPIPAYQQVLKGLPALDYTTRDMLYRPRNRRVHKAYGFSPVEQIVMTVNIALRRQLFTLQYFTEGNVPEALIGAPDNWTPEQIAAFQANWDAMLEGNLAQRRHAKFVPGGVGKTFIQTKDPELKGIFDEWLARITCYAFSVDVAPFIQARGMGGGKQAESAHDAALEEGLAPLQSFVKGWIDDIIESPDGFASPDLEFKWKDDREVDPEKQQTILTGYVKSAVLSVNEARDRLGEDPVDDPAADVPMVQTANGFVPIGALTVEGKLNAMQTLAPQLVGSDGKPIAAPAGGKDDDDTVGGTGEEPGAEGQASSAPKPQSGKQPPAKAPKKTPPKAADKVFDLRDMRAAASLSKDAKRTLYVMRPLTNADDVIEWAKAQGFGKTLTPDDMHVTIAFSKAKVDWSDAGDHFDTLIVPRSSEQKNGRRSVEKLGDKGAVVLRFESVELAKRWQQFRDIGASWDHDSYRPHVTITYQGDDVDLSAVEPYDGPLEFGAEQFAEVKDNWQDDVTEKGAGKTGRPFVLAKAAKRIATLRYNRPAMRKGTVAMTAAVGKVLKALSDDVAGQVKAKLKKLGKADSDDEDGKPDPVDAAVAQSTANTIAMSLDLSGMDALAAVTEEMLTGVGEDSARGILAQIGVTDQSDLVDQVNERVAAWARARSAEMVGKRYDADGNLVDAKRAEYRIDDATRDMIRANLADSLENNLPIGEIIDSLQESTAFSADRAELIARTEITRANNQSSLIAATGARDGQNLGMKKLWLTAGDDLVDEDICAPNEDDGPLELEDEFTSGDDAPPGHPRCRCTLVYDVEE